jgi:uncharacterized protein (DUF169 family)
VLGCSWLFTYPYLSSNVNYSTPALAFGMRARKVFEEGWMLMSIPYNWIPTITKNLQEMEWVPPLYSDTKEEAEKRNQRILEEVMREYQSL